MSIKFNRSQTFATNGTVTAAGLHNLVDGLDIYQALITDQTSLSAVAPEDSILIADASLTAGDAPRQTTVQNLFEDALSSGTYVSLNLSGALTYGTATGNRTVSTSATITTGTIPNFTAGTTTSTAANITTGTIATLNSTTGTIGNLSTTLAGDFTISQGTATLATSGVTASSYGTTSDIPRITVDSKGRITSATIVTAPVGFRNRIINGGMRIDQRNSGAAQTFTAGAALAYSVDRFYGYCTGANVTGQRVAGSGNNEFVYRFTGAASVTGIGFGTRLEATNTIDLAGSTATLSVQLANSLLTTVTWTVYYANSSDAFGTLASPTRTQIATGTFTVNSTLTKYSTQISIPSAATTGLEIVFTVGAQTSGTWTIDDVQLEAGSSATDFERRPYGMELALCQRYFQIIKNGSGQASATTAFESYFQFPMPMRAAPSAALTAAAKIEDHAVTIYTQSAASVALSNTAADGTKLNLANFSGLTASRYYSLAGTAASAGALQFSAEL